MKPKIPISPSVFGIEKSRIRDSDSSSRESGQIHD